MSLLCTSAIFANRARVDKGRAELQHRRRGPTIGTVSEKMYVKPNSHYTVFRIILNT